MNFRADIRSRAREKGKTVVFPESGDERTLEALVTLQREGLVRPVVLGQADEVHRAFAELGGDPDQLLVVDPTDPAVIERYRPVYIRRRGGGSAAAADADARISEPILLAGVMVDAGDADGAVAGAVHSTGEVLRAGIRSLGIADGLDTVSSSFYMVVPPFRGEDPEVLTFSDPAVVPDPNPRQLAEIAAAASDARRLVIGDEPRVAFLSFSTHGSARGAPVEKVCAALEEFRRLRPTVAADGELQGDAALIKAVADRKAPGSPVAGRANVLIFPDLGAGNIAYKLVERLAGATALGPIVQGLRCPYNDLSRGCTATDIVEIACITALMACAGA